MFEDIIKNPILHGILGGLLVYGYLYWEESKRKRKKEEKRKEINLMYPFFALVLVAIVSYFYQQNQNKSTPSLTPPLTTIPPPPQMTLPSVPLPLSQPSGQFVGDVMPTNDMNSLTQNPVSVLTRGVTMPQNLPPASRELF